MDLDGILLSNALIEEELGDFLALVTLELNDLAELGVGDESAIAVELLLEVLEDFVEREFLGDALNDGPTLPAIAALIADVDVGARRLYVELYITEFSVHKRETTKEEQELSN